LDRKAVVAEYATTAADGKTYSVSYYNLDMIIAVGYRVCSPRGVQFRQWATERLREYLLKGRDRVADYFDELLAQGDLLD
jgi:hypothetical protein